jgi:hypothetical protein
MAMKTKLIVISSCRFEGNHLAKGTTFEVDAESKKDAQRLAPLVHAGRVATWSPEVEKAVKAEIASEDKLAKKLDELAERPAEPAK